MYIRNVFIYFWDKKISPNKWGLFSKDAFLSVLPYLGIGIALTLHLPTYNTSLTKQCRSTVNVEIIYDTR